MNILIIEDSRTVAHLISSVLASENYITRFVKSSEFNPFVLKDMLYDIILINTKIDMGISKVLKEIRRETISVFIIGISTKSTWKEKVEFLNLGGDDVIDYPFPIQELKARINSLLRRPKENNEGVIKLNDMEINTQLKKVKINDKDVPLRRREFSLLEYMARNKNRTISRSELLDHVWDFRRSTGSNTVDVHIKRLRDKLNDRNIIETVHGFGYTIKKSPSPKAS